MPLHLHLLTKRNEKTISRALQKNVTHHSFESSHLLYLLSSAKIALSYFQRTSKLLAAATAQISWHTFKSRARMLIRINTFPFHILTQLQAHAMHHQHTWM